jgi:hypothetical protein
VRCGFECAFREEVFEEGVRSGGRRSHSGVCALHEVRNRIFTHLELVRKTRITYA